MSLLGETAKILYKTGLCRFFSIQQQGFKLKYFPTKMSKRLWISAIQKKNPYAVLDEFFIRHLKQGNIVIDAGANIGYYSLLSAAAVGASGYVYAIEAHPKTFSYLQKNINFNKFENIQSFHTALGNESGDIKFSNKDSDDLNQVDSAGDILVPIIRLDDLSIPDSRINLLKVDVEGYEKFVMQGAAKLLTRTDVILFESWDDHYRKFDYSLTDILAYLSSYGFLFMTYNANGFSEIEKDYSSLECEDIVAVRDIKQFLENLA
jgi:FkbM family methyltransferase